MEVRSHKDTGLYKQNPSTTKLAGYNRLHCSRKGSAATGLYVMITLCLPVLGLLFPLSGSAETLYCPIKNKMTVQVQYGFEQNLPMKTDEGMLIYLDNDSRFLEKIHVEVVISDSLKKYCDGLAVSLYSNLQPLPKEATLPVTGRVDGKKIFFALLPYTNRTFVQIPVEGALQGAWAKQSDRIASQSSKLEASGSARPAQDQDAATQTKKQNQPTNLPPGTLGVTDAPKASDFPLLLLIQPVTKGIPDTVLNKDFFINIKPELANKGLLQLTLNNKEKVKTEELVVHIDEKLINLAQLPLVLAAGMHKLKLESQSYKESIINFSLNPGEQKELQLALERNKTTLTIEATTDTIIFFDGNKLDVSPGERLEVEPGEHIIRFKIGSYSNSKKVIIQKGKNYTVNLILDIAIKED